MKAGRTLAILPFVCAAMFPASATETAIPDLSGIWARTTFGYDLPPPGVAPSPLRNLARRANGTSEAFKLVGDYNNPILRPEAARTVKEHGEISDRKSVV